MNIWIKYINKRGTLNNGRRIEVGLGHLQYYYLTGKGVKNLKIKNFTPHEFTENEKPKNNIKTVEDFKRAFGG